MQKDRSPGPLAVSKPENKKLEVPGIKTKPGAPAWCFQKEELPLLTLANHNPGRRWGFRFSRRRGSCCRSGGRSCRSPLFRRCEIAGDLALADVEDHDFVRRGATAAFHVKLHGLAG